MKTKTWTIFGAGDFINDIIDAIESRGEQAEFIVLNKPLEINVIEKIPSSIKILKLEEFMPSTDYYILGFVAPNKKPLLDNLERFKLHYSNLIHKFSYVSGTTRMGQGNFIGAGVVLAPYTHLGNYNYVNRSVSIGHDTEILNFNHFGPGCTVAGNCKIGNGNFLGSGSVLINNIEIGDEIIVGAGGVVVKGILVSGTYTGVPAKYVK
ncbi:hypothetical protein ACFLYF_00065 [Chloroflexota bacterium]